MVKPMEFEATVKHIEFGPQDTRLLAANPNYAPIDITREDSKIMGKVIGLIRNFEAGYRL